MVGGKSPTRLDTAVRALDLFVQQKVGNFEGDARPGRAQRGRTAAALTEAV